MKKTKLIAYVIVAALVVTVTHQYFKRSRINNRLELENADLRTHAILVAGLRVENDRLRVGKPELAAAETLVQEREERRRDQAELARLRQKQAAYESKQADEVKKIRSEIEELKAGQARGEDLREPNSFRTASLTGSILLSKAQNKGTTTPEALLETWLWAVEHQNGELLQKLQFWPEEVKDQIPPPEAILSVDESRFADVTDVILMQKDEKAMGDEVILKFKLKRNREPASYEPTQIDLWLKFQDEGWKIIGVTGRRTQEK